MNTTATTAKPDSNSANNEITKETRIQEVSANETVYTAGSSNTGRASVSEYSPRSVAGQEFNPDDILPLSPKIDLDTSSLSPQEYLLSSMPPNSNQNNHNVPSNLDPPATTNILHSKKEIDEKDLTSFGSAISAISLGDPLAHKSLNNLAATETLTDSMVQLVNGVSADSVNSQESPTLTAILKDLENTSIPQSLFDNTSSIPQSLYTESPTASSPIEKSQGTTSSLDSAPSSPVKRQGSSGGFKKLFSGSIKRRSDATSKTGKPGAEDENSVSDNSEISPNNRNNQTYANKKGFKDRFSMFASLTFSSNMTPSSSSSSHDPEQMSSSSPSLVGDTDTELSRSASLTRTFKLYRNKSKGSTASDSTRRIIGSEIPESVVESLPSLQQQSSQLRLYDASAYGKDNAKDISFHIAMELLSTEKNYAESLNIIIEQYMTPVKAAAKSDKPIISPMDIKYIFAQINELYSFTKDMIKDLEVHFSTNPESPTASSGKETGDKTKHAADHDQPSSNADNSSFDKNDDFLASDEMLDNEKTTADASVVDSQEIDLEKGGLGKLCGVFQSRIDNGKFQVYMKFVDNYAAAKSAILRNEEHSPAFRAFIQERTSKRETMRQSLNDLLIMPIQRIARYVLLLSDLKKHISPDHPEFPVLDRAVNGMKQLANSVNEVKRREEEMTRLFEVQKTIHDCPPTIISAHRKVLHESQVLELSKNRNFRIVIFSDRILFAKSTYKNHSIGAMIQTAAKKDKVKPWKMAGIYGLNQVNFPESSPDAHLPADSTDLRQFLICQVMGAMEKNTSSQSLDNLKVSEDITWTFQFQTKREKSDFVIIFNNALKAANVEGRSKSQGALTDDNK